MNVSVFGVLLVCGLAVFTSASAVLAYATVSREARSRRRRARLRLVVGNGTATPRPPRSAGARAVSPRPDDRGEASWDPLPVTQWQRPRERDHGPSPAA